MDGVNIVRLFCARFGVELESASGQEATREEPAASGAPRHDWQPAGHHAAAADDDDEREPDDDAHAGLAPRPEGRGKEWGAGLGRASSLGTSPDGAGGCRGRRRVSRVAAGEHRRREAGGTGSSNASQWPERTPQNASGPPVWGMGPCQALFASRRTGERPEEGMHRAEEVSNGGSTPEYSRFLKHNVRCQSVGAGNLQDAPSDSQTNS